MTQYGNGKEVMSGCAANNDCMFIDENVVRVA